MRKLTLVIISICMLLLVVSFASAITGSLGNARMILRVNVGDTVDNYIVANNVNNESIRVELFASGALENDTKILDNNFTLQPGESKDIRFQIKMKKAGNYETNLNVKYIPETGTGGVGLSAAIITYVKDSGQSWDDSSDVIDNSSSISDGNSTGVITSITNNLKNSLSPTLIAAIITFIILIIFFVLLLVLYRKSKRKDKRAVRSS